LKRKSRLVAVIALASLGLSSCGSTGSSGSTNLVCASIEGYLSSKALALVDSARGGSARESIDVMVGELVEGIESDSTSSALFESYLNAMEKWADAVDQYQVSKQSDALTAASSELEGRIDSLALECQSNGWKFEAGWRG
jgi:hypothetical protein